jgi:hypothetical protein
LSDPKVALITGGITFVAAAAATTVVIATDLGTG